MWGKRLYCIIRGSIWRINYLRRLFTKSNIHNETLLETIYDEVWEEYRVANCLSDDQLYALEQSSKTGTLPEIELETNKRFEELINI